MNLYRIEHTHEVTEVYLVEAESAEKAEEMFLNDDAGDIVDSWESDDFGTYKIYEANDTEREPYNSDDEEEDKDDDWWED